MGKNLLRTTRVEYMSTLVRITCGGEGTHSLVQDKSTEDCETAVH